MAQIERRKDGHRVQRLLRFVDMVRAEAHQVLWETAPDILRDEATALAEKDSAKEGRAQTNLSQAEYDALVRDAMAYRMQQNAPDNAPDGVF